MMFGVRQSTTCWIIKLARDERLDRFSPGQQLILEATRTMFEDEELMFADSCAEPGHPMIDHLWKDRLAVRDVLICNPNQPTALSGLIFMLERARRFARRQLRVAYRHLLKGAR